MYTKMEPNINMIWANLIYYAYLPGVTIGEGVTIEPLKENEKLSTVLLVKRDGVIDSGYI